MNKGCYENFVLVKRSRCDGRRLPLNDRDRHIRRHNRNFIKWSRKDRMDMLIHGMPSACGNEAKRYDEHCHKMSIAAYVRNNTPILPDWWHKDITEKAKRHHKVIEAAKRIRTSKEPYGYTMLEWYETEGIEAFCETGNRDYKIDEIERSACVCEELHRSTLSREIEKHGETSTFNKRQLRALGLVA